MIIEGLTAYITGKVLYDSSKKIAGKIKDAGVKVFFEERVEGIYKELQQKLNKKDAERKFQNHDLQRAVISSFYKSIMRITDEFLQQSIVLSNEVRVNLNEIHHAVNSIQKDLNVRLKELKDEKDPSLLDFEETSLLINPTFHEQSEEVEQFLCEKTKREFNIDSPLYGKLIKEHLYDYISRFFALEIKENPRVYNIFTAQSMVDNKFMLEEIQVAANLIADLTIETNENVKLILEMMIEMRSLLNGSTRNDIIVNSNVEPIQNKEIGKDVEEHFNEPAVSQVMLDYRRLQFRIDNAELLEDLENLNELLFKASIPLLENASAIKEFLANIEYLENIVAQTSLEEQLSTYHQKIDAIDTNDGKALINLINITDEHPLKPYRIDYKNTFVEKYQFDIIIDIMNLLMKSKEYYSLKIKHGFRLKLKIDQIISELKEIQVKVDKGSTYYIKHSYTGIFPLENYIYEGLIECVNILNNIGLELMREQEIISKNLHRYLL
ncbi:hypothetical protein QFZ87_000787 [Bacillus sp. SLBN-46]|uniref:hypothetical protein n=1 Tax=Bacillus sp. SLBN-46 TaxID=3042283 RepID=UPI0028554D3D|nr:hypothetical protein [Bacillus sp. SLBN-46]MDR6121190.1 hypothetical protein [Bacillus sp. SLBN-46]